MLNVFIVLNCEISFMGFIEFILGSYIIFKVNFKLSNRT